MRQNDNVQNWCHNENKQNTINQKTINLTTNYILKDTCNTKNCLRLNLKKSSYKKLGRKTVFFLNEHVKEKLGDIKNHSKSFLAKEDEK